MADSNKAGKGGGARKYGQNRRKCEAYRSRTIAGKTPKARRVKREMMRRGVKALGNWILRENGTVTVARSDAKKRYRRTRAQRKG